MDIKEFASQLGLVSSGGAWEAVNKTDRLAICDISPFYLKNYKLRLFAAPQSSPFRKRIEITLKYFDNVAGSLAKKTYIVDTNKKNKVFKIMRLLDDCLDKSDAINEDFKAYESIFSGIGINSIYEEVAWNEFTLQLSIVLWRLGNECLSAKYALSKDLCEIFDVLCAQEVAPEKTGLVFLKSPEGTQEIYLIIGDKSWAFDDIACEPFRGLFEDLLNKDVLSANQLDFDYLQKNQIIPDAENLSNSTVEYSIFTEKPKWLILFLSRIIHLDICTKHGILSKYGYLPIIYQDDFSRLRLSGTDRDIPF